MGRRAELSSLLVIGGIVLLISIAVGIGMGDRVLGQIGLHQPVQPTPVPPATAAPEDRGDTAGLETRCGHGGRDRPGLPRPAGHAGARAAGDAAAASDLRADAYPATDAQLALHLAYTSPPLPLPLVTHTPVAPSPRPDIEATPRSYSTLPPVPIPSVGN